MPTFTSTTCDSNSRTVLRFSAIRHELVRRDRTLGLPKEKDVKRVQNACKQNQLSLISLHKLSIVIDESYANIPKPSF